MALVQLLGQMRRSLRTFRKITGFVAVASLASSFPQSGKLIPLLPPVHPRCAGRRRFVAAAPCRKECLIHWNSDQRYPDVITPVCPNGQHCAFVPIRLDSQFVGLAKLVADPETTRRAFYSATRVLKLTIAATCQESLVSVLSREVGALQQRVAELQQVRSNAAPTVAATDPSVANALAEPVEVENIQLVERALQYLQEHYQSPTLTLSDVAAALGCNPRYLTSRFTQVVGEHMHSYLLSLRVAHARRMLADTELRVKEIAYASGFSGPSRLVREFRRHIGLPPARYRRIFAAP